MTGLVELCEQARSHTARTWVDRLRQERDALAEELAAWTHPYADTGNGLTCRCCGHGPAARVHTTPDAVRAALDPHRAGTGL